MTPAIHLVPWGPGDLSLLEQLLGDPAMTEHIGGPESPEKLAERQTTFENLPEGDRMFRIVEDGTGEGIGSVGYWERTMPDGEVVWETGWFVLPAFQGRGIATAATALAIEHARDDGRHRSIHAYPSVDNPPSNAICRKLGFTLVETLDVEYPPGTGNMLRCNDWLLDLLGGPSSDRPGD